MASRLLTTLALLLLPLLLDAQDTAPPLSGIAINTGEQISLETYHGKVVFVDFWASWCPPCLDSLPAYDRIRREISHEDFEIIAVNVDEDTQNGLAFLEKQPVSYPVLADPEGKIGIPWGIRTLPRSFLLDRQGRVVSVHKRFRPGDEVSLKKEIMNLLEASW